MVSRGILNSIALRGQEARKELVNLGQVHSAERDLNNDKIGEVRNLKTYMVIGGEAQAGEETEPGLEADVVANREIEGAVTGEGLTHVENLACGNNIIMIIR